MHTMKLVASALCSALAFAVITDAGAAEIRVRCEKREHRSKVSVDAGGLTPGVEYRARVISGDNGRTSAPQAAVGDEVEFDFDSNRNEIAAGATAIGPQFIQGGQVTGKILGPNGRVVVSDTELCRIP
ncbi:MAG TPA: hypothetical protein VJM11_13515 [Nevskiaceae bacterium]|nr:hypothetical protein [Nevskiaceae bacterium]